MPRRRRAPDTASSSSRPPDAARAAIESEIRALAPEQAAEQLRALTAQMPELTAEDRPVAEELHRLLTAAAMPPAVQVPQPSLVLPAVPAGGMLDASCQRQCVFSGPQPPPDRDCAWWVVRLVRPGQPFSGECRIEWQCPATVRPGDPVEAGPYRTQSEAESACVRICCGLPPPPHDGGGICEYSAPPPGCRYVPGPNYDPVTGCGMVLQCVPPPTMRWDCVDGQCVESEAGQYATRAECETACAATPPVCRPKRWTCRDGQCFEDECGEYDSYQACKDACVKACVPPVKLCPDDLDTGPSPTIAPISPCTLSVGPVSMPLTDAVQSDWCARLGCLAAAVRKVGDQVLGFGTVKADMLMSLLNSVGQVPASESGRVEQYIDAVTNHGMTAGIRQQWHAAVAQVYSDEAFANVQAFAAVRTLLIGLRDAVTTAAVAVEYKSGAGWGLHLPQAAELNPISAEGNQGTAGSSGSGGHYSLHAAVVVLIELIDVLIRWYAPAEAPGIPDAIELYLQDTITIEHCRCLIELAGGVWSEWERVITSRRERPQRQELLVLANRGELSDQDLDDRLRANGVLDAEDRSLLSSLRNEYPSSSDLVRFAVRHGFEPDLIRELGFSDEISPDFLRYHTALGFGWQFDIHHPIFGDWLGATWADMAWWSHWVWPAPQQAVHMGFRFASGRDRQWEDPDTAALDVDARKVNLLLRGNDYPPQFRDLIAGLGRPLPGMRMLRVGIRTGVLPRDYVIERFRKDGYSHYDSVWQTEALIQAESAARWKDELSQAGLSARAAWQAGALDDAGLLHHLSLLGFSAQQQQETLALAKVEHGIARVEEIKRRIRSAVLNGSINEPAAYQALQAAGVRQEFAADWSADWMYEATVEHRQMSARQLVKDACDGLLALPDLIVRLRNLRYSDDDVALMVTEAELCIIEAALRRAERAKAAAEKQREKLRKEKAGGASLKVLAKWFRDQRVDEPFIRDTLTARGWPAPEIDMWIQDALAPA